tara:strand:+ start:38341 stop:39225 length:885 start_codon:yes stop_codon:yes gene_type:complete
MKYEQMLPGLAYEVNDRKFADIADIVAASKDYNRFSFKAEPGNDTVYTGAEHNPTGLASKLSNLTHLPNLDAQDLTTEEMVIVMGCTMGHHQDMEGVNRMQEIYEFLGYGAMVIDHDGSDRVEMHVAQKGDKVVVPNECHMTIYNLDSEPLNTGDFANPNPKSPNYNAANKDMQKEIGAVMVVYQAKDGLHFDLNDQYFDPSTGLAASYGSGMHGVQSHTRSIVISDLGLGESDLGERLHTELTKGSVGDEFAKLGVDIIGASPEVDLGSGPRSDSLFDIVMDPSRPLQTLLGL